MTNRTAYGSKTREDSLFVLLKKVTFYFRKVTLVIYRFTPPKIGSQDLAFKSNC